MEHKIHRYPHRARTDRALLDALLDEQWVGTLSGIADGEPYAIPILFTRIGDQVIFHGSSGSGMALHTAQGAQVCFTVFAMDAVLVAPTAGDTSLNYRSAVLRGTLTHAPKQDRPELLTAFTEKFLPGRVAETAPATKKEVAHTAILVLPIEEGKWLYKTREDTDAGPVPGGWSGLVPISRHFGPLQPDPGVSGPVPESVRRLLDS